jgi:hypothetical protein
MVCWVLLTSHYQLGHGFPNVSKKGSSRVATSACAIAEGSAITLLPDRVGNSHKGSIGPGGTCFVGAGAGYPLRALLGQDEKHLNTHGPRHCAWQGEAEPMIEGRAHDSHARRLLVGRQSC